MKKINLLITLCVLSLVSCNTTPSSEVIDNERTVKSIEVVKRSDQNVFAINEILDLTGLKVKVTYNDQSSVIVGHGALNYPNIVTSTTQDSIELEYEGVTTTLDGLEFRTPNRYYLEAEAYEAYWSKPNNHNRETHFVVSESSQAHGGKYVSGLKNECFGLTYMFYAEDIADATFVLSSDTRTTLWTQGSQVTEPQTRPLSEIYEFHVNGEKVELTGELVHGEWGVFRKVDLGKAKLREGLNTVSLTHIIRNGENGNIDFIRFDTATKITLCDYSTNLIEAEDMQLSSPGDYKNEGNNASLTGTNKNHDNIGNRAAGQTGWMMTTVHSDSYQKVALFINFGLCSSFNMSEWTITVNDKKVEYVDTVIPHHFWSGIEWRDWNEFYICELDLVEGDNVIKIDKTISGTNGTNIDYIKILSV